MTATALSTRLTSALQSRSDRQILRTLTPTPTPTPPSSSPLIDFSSNDYLSFSHSPLLRSKFLSSLASLPSPYGPPSSRLLDGNTPLHLSLEFQLASFFHAKSALLFNSGFDANVGLWSSLPAEGDFVVYDEMIHASTHDGMRASRVDKEARRAFRHNDVSDLERVLEALKEGYEGVRNGTRSVWVTVETLYSMDGDLAPLVEVVQTVERVLERGNGHLVVDEAHSTGLYGPQGRGIVAALGLEDRIEVRVHTFGKSMASSGSVVLCNPLIRSYLINYARPLIYSTTMTHMSALAVSKAFEMLQEGHGDAPAAQVHALSSHLLSHLSTFLTPSSHPISCPTLHLPPSSSPSLPPTTPIIPLLTRHPRVLSAHLARAGFLVRPISYPTVPRDEARVRVCLHAGNTKGQVEDLARVLEMWCVGQREKEKEKEKEKGEEQGGGRGVAKL